MIFSRYRTALLTDGRAADRAVSLMHETLANTEALP